LYVVATPIGNLGDMSPRAVDVLRQVDRIAAEDTRHSRPLLEHFDVRTPMIAYHEHNERQQAPRLLRNLRAGESIALISDAGTPLVSDPGYHLVRAAVESGLRVTPIPGASALICALSASGLPTDRFVFEGFLPAKRAQRQRRLQALAGETRTLAFFESSHRIAEMLVDVADAFGPERRAVMARELTKTFETIRCAPAAELAEWVSAQAQQRKGEFVILVHGAEHTAQEDGDHVDHILRILLEELPVKQAAALAARITDSPRNRLYKRALTLAGKTG
jgi:16S rRNA (cytidine1402-2'-O)-methyltransferase